MYRNDSDPLNRAQSSSGRLSGATPVTPNTLSGEVRTVPREGFLTGSFVWMFVGVLLSAATAWFVMSSEVLQQQVADIYLFLLIGALVLGVGINMLITRISPVVALGLFFVYAITWGLMLGLVVLAYVGSTGVSGVVSAFAGASAVFGAAAFYGIVTKRDLTSIAGYLFVGVIGLLVVMVLQLFFFADSSMASLAIGVVGVLLFTGITAYDVQRLKNGTMPGVNKDSATVQGALALYIDFLMLFLMMLRIFGSSR